MTDRDTERNRVTERQVLAGKHQQLTPVAYTPPFSQPCCSHETERGRVTDRDRDIETDRVTETQREANRVTDRDRES